VHVFFALQRAGQVETSQSSHSRTDQARYVYKISAVQIHESCIL
jgi:hypothetical protein